MYNMKLKLSTLLLRNSLILLLYTLFSFSSLTAQITSFGLRVTPSDTVNVTEGNAVSYELRDLSNTVVIAPQTSNILTSIPPGDYLVVVTDACNDEHTQGVVITNPIANYEFTRNRWGSNTINSEFNVLQDCDNYLHSEEIIFNGSNVLPDYVYPINLTITVEDPSNPGSPTIITDTYTSNAQNNTHYSIPFYLGESYEYKIELTDACGNTQDRIEIIDAESEIRYNNNPTSVCGRDYLRMDIFDGWVAPLNISFTSYPAGFDPSNYRSEFAAGSYNAKH